MSSINTWPGWNCVRQIGSGSYGKVYEIERIEGGISKKSALKVVSIPLAKDDILSGFENGDYSTIRDANTFYNTQISIAAKEFETLQKLGNCKNIVQYENHMIVPHEGWPGADIVLRMEFLTPLNRYRTNHTLNEFDIVKIGMDICNALAACHSSKPQVLHRDVKPDNILVDNDGNYKLADFGVARIIEGSKSAHTVAGTEDFMAPEVLKGDGYRATADIYSLGLVLYKLLNNNRGPFLPIDGALSPMLRSDAKTRRLNGQKIPAPAYGKTELKNAILKAIEYNPNDRWQTAESFRDALARSVMQNNIHNSSFDEDNSKTMKTIYESKEPFDTYSVELSEFEAQNGCQKQITLKDGKLLNIQLPSNLTDRELVHLTLHNNQIIYLRIFIKKEASPQTPSVKNDYNPDRSNALLGTLGAILGGLLSSLLWILLMQLNIIAGLAGFVSAYCILKGYILLGKKLDKKGTIISIIILIITVYLSVRAGYIVSFMRLSADELNKSDIYKMYILYFEKLMVDIDSIGLFVKDLIISYIFTLLGSFAFVKRMAKNKG